MIGIFHHLKKGSFNKLLQNCLKELRPLSDSKRIDTDRWDYYFSKFYKFISDFRFVQNFVVKDYGDLRLLNRNLDRFALPNDLKDKKKFKQIKDTIDHIFKAHIEQGLKKKFRKLTDIEIMRLDEALITLQARAYFSSIVMGVSAVEGRLHTIVKNNKPSLYKKEIASKFTLGKLFNKVISDHNYKSIKETLPEKFSSLLNICNEYRVFSAHPKTEIMTYQDALSVFGLSLSFLLQPEPKKKY